MSETRTIRFVVRIQIRDEKKSVLERQHSMSFNLNSTLCSKSDFG